MTRIAIALRRFNFAGEDRLLRAPAVVLGNYLSAAKPGIVLGNLVTLAGGFLLASRGSIDARLLLATMLGLALVVASGCVFNNYIDRDIDRRMQRTRNRVLVREAISPQGALTFAALTGLAGVAVLAFATNLLAALVVILGFAVYVGAYSLWLKRHSVYGTLVGSLAGAVPPVVGYCAVTGRLDPGAALLLLVFALWQIPHFYAIAIFRLRDYEAAAIPVLPAVKGVEQARRHMLGYIAAFTAAAVALSLAGYTGSRFMVAALAIGGYWLRLAWAGRLGQDDRLWARRLFFYSILAVLALSLAMSLDYVR